MARAAGPGKAVTQNTSGSLVPTSLPSAHLESIASARSRGEAGSQDRQRTLRVAPVPTSHAGGLQGEAHRTPHRACPSRPSRRPPAQPRSHPVAVATGSRGEGLRRGGCYFCRFLFLAATSPWQPSYSARPPPGPAGARDPGRSRPLVPPPAPSPVPAAGREAD